MRNNNEKMIDDAKMSTNNMSRVVWVHSEFFFVFLIFFANNLCILSSSGLI